MRALTYDGIKKVSCKSVPDPKIEKPDDIIVKITSSAICGSDLHIFRGKIPKVQKGSVIGHEAIGYVAEAGPEVRNLKKGDRVVVPFPLSCGICRFCREGLTSQCDNSNPNGEVGAVFGYGALMGGYDGAQAEYLRVPYANSGPRKVPEEYTDEQLLFLGDILPTSYWGTIVNGGVKPKDTVVVLGCGPVGLLAQKWAAYAGAKRIIAVDNVEYRLRHAKKHNGAEILNFEDFGDTGEYIKEITHGGADVVVDCVGLDGKTSLAEKAETVLRLQGGSKSAIETAAKAVRKEGKVSLVGIYGSSYNNFPLGDFFSRNITLRMGQCPAHSYIGPILDLIVCGKFDATDIITHTIPLCEGARGYEVFDSRTEGCIKVVLKP